ncbi:DNA repair metallo-beta-lactamase-domain-containing protein, partial [Thamnocephalis sphaerospora]
AIGSKVCVTAEKRAILDSLDDVPLSTMLTTDPSKASVHVALVDYLERHRSAGFTSVVAFRPTGWTHTGPKQRVVLPSDLADAALPPTVPPLTARALRPTRHGPRVTLYSIPYSEHSSFRELACFVRTLSIRGRVQPTVNVSNERSRRQMQVWLDAWRKANQRAGGPLPLGDDIAEW